MKKNVEHYNISVTKFGSSFEPISSLNSRELYNKVHELSFELAGIVNQLNDKEVDDIISNVVRAADASLYSLLVVLNVELPK